MILKESYLYLVNQVLQILKCFTLFTYTDMCRIYIRTIILN